MNMKETGNKNTLNPPFGTRLLNADKNLPTSLRRRHNQFRLSLKSVLIKKHFPLLVFIIYRKLVKVPSQGACPPTGGVWGLELNSAKTLSLTLSLFLTINISAQQNKVNKVLDDIRLQLTSDKKKQVNEEILFTPGNEQFVLTGIKPWYNDTLKDIRYRALTITARMGLKSQEPAYRQEALRLMVQAGNDKDVALAGSAINYLTHFNRRDFTKEACDSVAAQDYPGDIGARWPEPLSTNCRKVARNAGELPPRLRGAAAHIRRSGEGRGPAGGRLLGRARVQRARRLRVL